MRRFPCCPPCGSPRRSGPHYAPLRSPVKSVDILMSRSAPHLHFFAHAPAHPACRHLIRRVSHRRAAIRLRWHCTRSAAPSFPVRRRPALHRGARRHARGRRRRVRLGGRPDRLRQEHAAQRRRRPARAEHRARSRCSASRSSGINRRAGYMFQTESLMPWRTRARQRDGRARVPRRAPMPRRAQAEEWLQRVGLGGFGDRYPHQLSGGMRKRVSLAQTLVLDPDIILMDEPFSRARHPDPPADGKRSARALGREEEGGALHHPRPRRGDRDERPRGRALGRPGVASDRRVRDRPAAPARRRRGARDAALRRAAQRDLGRAARRGAEGLRSSSCRRAA